MRCILPEGLTLVSISMYCNLMRGQLAFKWSIRAALSYEWRGYQTGLVVVIIVFVAYASSFYLDVLDEVLRSVWSLCFPYFFTIVKRTSWIFFFSTRLPGGIN